MGWWLLRLSTKLFAFLRPSVDFFQLRLTKKLKMNFFSFKKLNIMKPVFLVPLRWLVINTRAFCCDKFSVITFWFLTRWLRNFANRNRYHSAIIRNIPISLMVNIS